MSRILVSMIVGAVALVTAPSVGKAQDDDVFSSSSSSRGGGSRIGVGAETILTAPFLGAPTILGASYAPGGAASVTYDTGQFRISGLLYLLAVEDSYSSFGLGARFFYVVHESKTADFSLGGGAAVTHHDPDPGRSRSRVHIEGALQIRIFLASNVALHGTVGLGFGFGDEAFLINLGGQLTGGFGLTYYF